MIRRLIDALTGYEWFMPTMAIVFGLCLVFDDATGVTRRGTFGIAAVVLDVILLTLVVTATVNDRIEARKWDEAQRRNRLESAQQITEESGR